MNRRDARWLLPAALLVAAGFLSFIAQIFFLPGDVKPADWKSAAEYVAEHIGPNDVINVQPNWSEAPYPYLTEVGDQILRQKSPLLGDIHDRENLWLLVETERLDEALAKMPFPAKETESFDTITVARIEIPDDDPVVYDLLDNLAHAKVTRVNPQGEILRRCTNWNARKRAWYCGRPDAWLYVGEQFLTIGDDPHRCIWANPPEAPERWRITYPDVPLAETFRVRSGISFIGARSRRGTDVHIRVSVGEKWSQTRTIPARETSWDAIDFDTSSLAGQRADVSVEIWSESLFDRFVCFNGWAIKG
jgi:hypothetical protein